MAHLASTARARELQRRESPAGQAARRALARTSFLSRLSSTGMSSSPPSQVDDADRAVSPRGDIDVESGIGIPIVQGAPVDPASGAPGVIFAGLVRKRLVRPGTRAKPGVWTQRRLELHDSPFVSDGFGSNHRTRLKLLWFEPNARSKSTGPGLEQRLPQGVLPLAAGARVEPHPGSAANHRRQLMVHQGEGGDGGVLRIECATAKERDEWVGAIGRALTAQAASASAATLTPTLSLT